MSNDHTPTTEAQAYARFHDLSTVVANDMFRGNTVTHGDVDRIEAALAAIVSFCETDLEKQAASEGRAEFVARARAYARQAAFAGIGESLSQSSEWHNDNCAWVPAE